MIELEKIKEISFSYFDSNGYIYPFEMLEDSLEFKNNQVKCYMYCKATNLSANGEVFLHLKIENDELYFRTDYFANSNEYTKLTKSSDDNMHYKVNFVKDYLELNLQ